MRWDCTDGIEVFSVEGRAKLAPKGLREVHMPSRCSDTLANSPLQTLTQTFTKTPFLRPAIRNPAQRIAPLYRRRPLTYNWLKMNENDPLWSDIKCAGATEDLFYKRGNKRARKCPESTLVVLAFALTICVVFLLQNSGAKNRGRTDCPPTTITISSASSEFDSPTRNAASSRCERGNESEGCHLHAAV